MFKKIFSMEAKIFFFVLFLAFSMMVKAQNNFFVNTGVLQNKLTEIKTPNAKSVLIGLGIQRKKVAISTDFRYANHDDIAVPRLSAEVNDFFQMTTFQANLLLNYEVFQVKKLKVSIASGYAFAKRDLNTIANFKTDDKGNVTSLEAKSLDYQKHGFISQINVTLSIYKKINLFSFADYTIFAKKVSDVKNAHQSDAVSFGIGLRIQ